jgi:hypothetical protein
LYTDVWAAIGVCSRHFGMHNTSTRCHELETASFDCAFIAGKIFVVDFTVEQISDRF